MIQEKKGFVLPNYFGHRRRLRERFFKSGLDGFHDYEILELVLTHAIPRMNTKPLAKELMGRFKNIAGVLEASVEELMGIKGIGPQAAHLLVLFKPVCLQYLRYRIAKRDALGNPEQVADYCRLALAARKHEVVYVIFLDIKNRIISEQVIFQGTLDESAVYPRRIVEEGLSCGAAGFILVHNHPSGSVQPSPADRALTKKILKVAEAVELRFLDHLIVGSEGHFSFRKEGFLA